LNIAQVNKDASSLSQNATDLSSLEISYFKALVRVSHGIPSGHFGRRADWPGRDAQIENIVESYPANSVGSTRALKIAGELACESLVLASHFGCRLC
jgi:hypothetical protein